MGATSIEIAGVVIQTPVNVATNLLLTLQCVGYYRYLSRREGEWARCWALFFQMMAVATAAGVVKHGFHYLLGVGAFTLVLAISNVASGFSTHSAQRATVTSLAAPERRSLLQLLTTAQLAVFLAANVAVGPDIMLLIANTAVGLIPVIVVEARAFLRGSTAGGAVAGGLTLSILGGAAYVMRFSPSPWFDCIDVAHLVMGISFELLRRGAARAPSGSLRGSPAPSAREVVRSLDQEVPWPGRV
jgi:hypothetical protein